MGPYRKLPGAAASLTHELCKPIDIQILFLLASYLHVGKESGVLTNLKMEKKEQASRTLPCYLQ